MNSYALGTKVTLQATFTEVASGNLVSPTTVACRIRLPNRAIVDLTAAEASTGVFTTTFTPDMAGVHIYKFQGTGNCQVSGYDSFEATGVFP